MAKTLERWIATDVAELQQKGQKYISTIAFFRGDCRATMIDDDHFFSPADGILVQQGIIQGCYDPIVNVKGKEYTLADAVGSDSLFDEEQEYYVINIFLTQYHRHIINLPFSGFVSTELTGPIVTHNRPMLNFEKKLTKGIIDWNEANYLFTNERRLDTVTSPKIGGPYYLLWVADSDVNNLCSYFDEQQTWANQNAELGRMLYGSSIFLIIPKYGDMELEFRQKIGMCVEAKNDVLLSFK